MSGSKEELPTVPDETVEPRAAVEPQNTEDQSAADQTIEAETVEAAVAEPAKAEVEMTAAEALARATRAADDEKQDDAPAARPAPSSPPFSSSGVTNRFQSWVPAGSHRKMSSAPMMASA